LGKGDERQAIETIAAMIAQWRREHDRDDHPPDVPHPPAGIMTEPAAVPLRPAHLARELGKCGSYSAAYGPHALNSWQCANQALGAVTPREAPCQFCPGLAVGSPAV
jgi:hypothetical protein